ncbi:MAG: hypothetical protein GEV05_25510 [Betaproteobacteria bacterium]|nr:hypothetical protein [Betaproteobacteria bacterium]
MGLSVGRGLKLKMAVSIPVQERGPILVQVQERLQRLIGPVLSSARQALAACIDDDLAAGRVKRIRGLEFSHTEVALFLSACTRDT